MKGKHILTFSVFLLLYGILCFPTHGEDATKSSGAQVTITPEPTDGILANPSMGWETFHRTSRQDRNLPSWIPSTVHYIRWGWGELEPQPGTIDFVRRDRVLKQTHDSGQKLALSPTRSHCPASFPLAITSFLWLLSERMIRRRW